MIKPSTLNPNKQELSILNLEKKYMLELKKIFQSQEFKTHLKDLIKKYPNSIAETYESPPLAIPFERLIHFHFYRHFKSKIIDFYNSPISSDVAVILDDCVLGIDAKTLSIVSNSSDFNQVQCGPNQYSFRNKLVSTSSGHWMAQNKLEMISNGKPILSFFLHLHYSHRKKKDFRDIKYYSHDKYKTISLVSIPNGLISKYFNQNIIHGFKTYDQVTDLKLKRLKLRKTVQITFGKTKYKYLDENQAKAFLKPHVHKNLFKETYPVHSNNGYNFICKKTNIIYRYRIITSNKKGLAEFGPEEASGTCRIAFAKPNKYKTEGITERFDAKDKLWNGVEHWDIY